jgi:hypothetical protein
MAAANARALRPGERALRALRTAALSGVGKTEEAEAEVVREGEEERAGEGTERGTGEGVGIGEAEGSGRGAGDLKSLLSLELELTDRAGDTKVAADIKGEADAEAEAEVGEAALAAVGEAGGDANDCAAAADSTTPHHSLSVSVGSVCAAVAVAVAVAVGGGARSSALSASAFSAVLRRPNKSITACDTADCAQHNTQKCECLRFIFIAFRSTLS